MAKKLNEPDQSRGEFSNKGDVIIVGDTSNSQIAAGRNASVSVTSGSPQFTDEFERLMAKIRDMQNISHIQRDDAIAEVSEIKEKIGTSELNEDFLSRRLRNIARMGNDILDVITATLLSPAIGLSEVIRKVVQRARTEAGLNTPE